MTGGKNTKERRDEEQALDPEMFEKYCSSEAIAHALKEKEEGEMKTLPPKSKKTNQNPQDKIDLHLMTRKKAESEIRQFMQKAIREKLKVVLIITGRGLHSQQGAVLPTITEKMIETWKEQRVIRSYKWVSSGGAIEVHLP